MFKAKIYTLSEESNNRLLFPRIPKKTERNLKESLLKRSLKRIERKCKKLGLSSQTNRKRLLRRFRAQVRAEANKTHTSNQLTAFY